MIECKQEAIMKFSLKGAYSTIRIDVYFIKERIRNISYLFLEVKKQLYLTRIRKGRENGQKMEKTKEIKANPEL